MRYKIKLYFIKTVEISYMNSDYEFIVELLNGVYLYPLVMRYDDGCLNIRNNIYDGKMTIDYDAVKTAFINLINNNIYFNDDICKRLNENDLIITDEKIIIRRTVCTTELVITVKDILNSESKIYCKKEKQICKKRYIRLNHPPTIGMYNIMKKSKYITPFINYKYKDIPYKYSTFKNNNALLFLNVEISL